MTCRYTLTVTARCPNDTSTVDVYEVVVEGETMIAVEAILDRVEALAREPIYQEDLTDQLARCLGGRYTVTTTGTHSGVRTEVTA